jgi:hypothetical protein
LTQLGQFEEAGAAYRQSLALNPEKSAAKVNYAGHLLLRGEYAEGWPLYEARGREAGFANRAFAQPRWNGEPLEGRRVLIHAEQGLGDSIHFIRYAELIAARGGEVIVECQQPLVELLHTSTGVREVVPAGHSLPPFDLQIPMLSQPLVFGTTPATIPNNIPYLFPEPAHRQAWQKLLHPDRKHQRVGLAWAGNPQHRRNRIRNVPLEKLLPLLALPNIDFYSLQLGAEASEVHQYPEAASLIDLTGHIQDFADTAALMSELDLIISIDSAVAHLAGALGRPVWTLLPYVPDWRWRLAGETTPWYPTMRLFRQPAIGDWDSVVQRVVHELGDYVKANS